MELKDALYSRRSVREYASTPVAESLVRGLIDAAIQAPSAVNSQPWSFTVVQDRSLLARICTASKAYVLERPPGGLSAEHLRRLQDPAFDIFYGAPALIVVSSVAEDRWAVENCTLAAQNLMLAACATGLGSCWIGFAQGWLASEPGKAALELPAGRVPVAPLIVGYPRSPAAAVPRRAPAIRWLGP